jgi:hypothetical protein
MADKSPLKGRPLRNPGQGLDEELQRLRDDQAAPYFWFAAVFVLLAGMEWLAYLRDAPRQPVTFTVVAVAISTYSGLRLWQLRRQSRRLKLGRDGERAVGQFLEGLRVHGARIFHDVPAEGFNLDHVVIAQQGVFVIETKTWSKRHPDARITFDGSKVLKDGHAPDRDPVAQVRGEVSWLKRTLEESTGKALPIRGVVVFPGWFVEPMTAEAKREVWVLEPKALPAFIEQEDAVIAESDVALAAYHLSRYVRSSEGLGRE